MYDPYTEWLNAPADLWFSEPLDQFLCRRCLADVVSEHSEADADDILCGDEDRVDLGPDVVRVDPKRDAFGTVLDVPIRCDRCGV